MNRSPLPGALKTRRPSCNWTKLALHRQSQPDWHDVLICTVIQLPESLEHDLALMLALRYPIRYRCCKAGVP